MNRRLAIITTAAALASCSSDPAGTKDAGPTDYGYINTEEDVPTSDAAATDTAAPDPEDVAAPDPDVPVDLPDTPTAEDVAVEPPDVPVVDVYVDTTPPPDITPVFANCTNPGGNVNIYDLQDPQCPDHIVPAPITTATAVPVTLEGVVVSAVFGDTFFVQEKPGGPYSGMAVFTHGIPTTGLQPGSVVTVTGGYSEYFDNSQLYLDSFEITGLATPPIPYEPEYPQYLSSDSPVAEYFEGVLVRVTSVKTINTKPDCPQDYGEFSVTGNVRVDDMGYLWKAHIGDEIASVTGPLHYTFGNFKIEPRDETDLVITKEGSATAVTKCIANACQVLETNTGTREVIVNEIMADPLGDDVGQEWIELYNPGSSPVDVTGWELRDCGDQSWPIAGQGLVIKAGGYLVLGQDTDTTKNGGAPVKVSYSTAFYLSNTIGSVLLFDGSGTAGKLVDQARYSRFEPWTVFKVGKGLERVSKTSDGTQPSGWKTATTDYGTLGNLGTPGKKND